MPFPQWSYFPRNEAPAEWVEPTVRAVAAAESEISTGVVRASNVNSDGVLRAIASGLVDVGWAVETGKRAGQKIERPVLYGDNGDVKVKYEIDGWHPVHQVALEVEAGRGAANNADYRDIVRALATESRLGMDGPRQSALEVPRRQGRTASLDDRAADGRDALGSSDNETA